jgi:hypothetical protein
MNMENSSVHTDMQTCIQNCTECHKACLETIIHCLSMGGKHATQEHIRLLQDCAQICQTSADFMIRGSDMHSLTCGLCAQICERCADDCQQLDPYDSQMQACADICRQCAESCRQMAGKMAA